VRPLAAAAALVIAGCISTGNVPPVQFYVLANAGRPAEARPAAEGGRVLLVSPMSVNSFYDTQRLAYSRAEGQRAYYQFAAWTERPGRTLTELLSRRLGAPLTTAGVRGDLVLQARLEELYHDARTAPGVLKLEVSAELVDAAGRRVAERRFSRSAPVSEENAAAATAAACRALTELLDEIAAWTERAAREDLPTKSALSSLFRP
jgi:cholesterol transport system auxiliary component